jgi:hypothetical protein
MRSKSKAMAKYFHFCRLRQVLNDYCNEYNWSGEMKKEWIYFIAGAGLIGAIMFFTMSAEHSTYKECMVKEMQKMPKDSNPAFVSAYCYEKHGS